MKKTLLALLLAVMMLFTAALALAEGTDITFSLDDYTAEIPGALEAIADTGLSFYLPEGFVAYAVEELGDEDTLENLVGYYEAASDDSEMTIYVQCGPWDEAYTNEAVIALLEDNMDDCVADVYTVNGKEVVIAVGTDGYEGEDEVYKVVSLFGQYDDKAVCITVWGCGSEDEENIASVITESLSAAEAK